MQLTKLISRKLLLWIPKSFLPSKVGHNIGLGRNKNNRGGRDLHHQDFLNMVPYCLSVFGIHQPEPINFVKEFICPPLELSTA